MGSPNQEGQGRTWEDTLAPWLCVEHRMDPGQASALLCYLGHGQVYTAATHPGRHLFSSGAFFI